MKNSIVFLIIEFFFSSVSAQINQNADTIPNITEHRILLKKINSISDSISMISPEKNSQVNIYNSENGIYYVLMFKKNLLLKESYLGLKITILII
jgi:hypothetical protein